MPGSVRAASEMKSRIEIALRWTTFGDVSVNTQGYRCDWEKLEDKEIIEVIDGRDPLAVQVRISEDVATEILRDSPRL